MFGPNIGSSLPKYGSPSRYSTKDVTHGSTRAPGEDGTASEKDGSVARTAWASASASGPSALHATARDAEPGDDFGSGQGNGEQFLEPAVIRPHGEPSLARPHDRARVGRVH